MNIGTVEEIVELHDRGVLGSLYSHRQDRAPVTIFWKVYAGWDGLSEYQGHSCYNWAKAGHKVRERKLAAGEEL